MIFLVLSAISYSMLENKREKMSSEIIVFDNRKCCSQTMTNAKK